MFYAQFRGKKWWKGELIIFLNNKARYFGDDRMDEKLNMSIRRFLKKVGITSQNEIENAWKDNKSVKVKMVLTIEELGLEHTIEGEIGEDWIKIHLSGNCRQSFDFFILEKWSFHNALLGLDALIIPGLNRKLSRNIEDGFDQLAGT